MSLELRGVAGRARWLATGDVDLTSRVRADVRLEPDAAGWVVAARSIEVARDDFALSATGAAILPPAGVAEARADIELRIAEASCGSLLASLPTAITGPLRGMRMRGSTGALFRIRYDGASGGPAGVDVELDPNRCKVLDEPPALAATLAARAAPEVSLAALPAHVSGAFLAAEDSGFYRHHGFELGQIGSSLAHNLRAGRLLRGGSTITQQVAKNLFLGHQRTVARKLQEAVLTWRLEAALDKRHILERYLNLIQLAESTFGIEAGARHWFGKRATTLSPREAAFLACLTRSPVTTSRAIRRDGAIAPELSARIDEVIRSMRFAGTLEPQLAAQALRAPLALRPLALASR